MNVSSLDSLRIPACAWTAKNYPLIVPPRRLSAMLLEAVDVIGAFSKHNPEWAEALRVAGEAQPGGTEADAGGALKSGRAPQLPYLRHAENINAIMEAVDF